MKRFLYITGLLFVVVLFAQCNKKRTADNCTENLKSDCICPTVYEPVCGCNNVTYGNSCEAECHGITDYTTGKCP